MIYFGDHRCLTLQILYIHSFYTYCMSLEFQLALVYTLLPFTHESMHMVTIIALHGVPILLVAVLCVAG